jgi:hypothetical protein
MALLLDGFTNEEKVRWLWLRSVEWAALPAYTSALYVPIALIFWPWYFVIPVVFVLGVLWCAIRYQFISPRLAMLMALVVPTLKWPVALISAGVLVWQGHYGIAFLAFIWQFLTGFIGIPGKVGILQLRFAERLQIEWLFS